MILACVRVVRAYVKTSANKNFEPNFGLTISLYLVILWCIIRSDG